MHERPSSQKATQFTVTVGTFGFIVAWLAVACYAVAYLVTH